MQDLDILAARFHSQNFNSRQLFNSSYLYVRYIIHKRSIFKLGISCWCLLFCKAVEVKVPEETLSGRTTGWTVAEVVIYRAPLACVSAAATAVMRTSFYRESPSASVPALFRPLSRYCDNYTNEILIYNE